MLGAPAHWGLASSDGAKLVVFAYADPQSGRLGSWYTADGKTWIEPASTGGQGHIPAFIQSAQVNSRVDAIFATRDGVVVLGQENGALVAWFAAAN